MDGVALGLRVLMLHFPLFVRRRLILSPSAACPRCVWVGLCVAPFHVLSADFARANDHMSCAAMLAADIHHYHLATSTSSSGIHTCCGRRCRCVLCVNAAARFCLHAHCRERLRQQALVSGGYAISMIVLKRGCHRSGAVIDQWGEMQRKGAAGVSLKAGVREASSVEPLPV